MKSPPNRGNVLATSSRVCNSRTLQGEPLEQRRLLAADFLQPFDGSAVLYQIHGTSGNQGQLSEIDIAAGAFVDVGSRAGFKINGIGYRSLDNLIYGMEMSNDHLIRLGSDGHYERLGAVSGLPNGSYYTGDFGHDGLLYVRNNNSFYGIDVDGLSVVRTVQASESVSGIADIAFNPKTDLYYAIRRQRGTNKTADFISIDLREGSDLGKVTVLSSTLSPGGTYGAVFADGNGRIFAANNAGGLFEVEVETGEAIYAGKTPRASSNDGASSTTAAMNLPPVTVDGFLSTVQGVSGVALNISPPVDLEKDELAISVAELPKLGNIRTTYGTVGVGDTLTIAELTALVYDAPPNYEEQIDPGKFGYTVSDGNSEVFAKVDIQLTGGSRVTGQLIVLDDSDIDEYEGFVFNNEIELHGVDFQANEVSLVVTTDFYGTFEFRDVLPGRYRIEQVQVDGIQDGFASSGDLGEVASSNLIVDVEIPLGASGEFNGYQFVDYAPSSLSGFVFVDENLDGHVNVTEEGIAQVSINLEGIDEVGQVVYETVVTDSFGFYEFTDLRPGVYSLAQVQPDAYTTSAELVGSAGGTATVNLIGSIELGAGHDGQGYSFGELESGRISGTVYIDADIDRALDDGDAGIAGNSIRLVGVDFRGDAIDIVRTTDSDGNYSFDDLLPGIYTLIQTVQPEGLSDGKENVGTFHGMGTNLVRNGVAGNDQISGINLQAGDWSRDNNFGERLEVLLAQQFDQTLILEATPENDVIEVTMGEFFHVIRINGTEQQIIADRVVDIHLDALGGDDIVIITGTDGIEEVVMRSGHTKFHGQQWRFQVFRAEDVTVYGNGGYDLAFLHGTAGNDKVKATQSYLRMEGVGYMNKAAGFHRAKAYSMGGDDDRAYFYDSAKDDTIKLTESNVRMFSRKFYNAAIDFDRVYAYAVNGGTDHARFWDSAADADRFEARPESARMWNSDFYNATYGFEYVIGLAAYGGANDRAYLYDSAGDDILVSSPRESGISGDGFEYRIENFERTYAYASAGSDRAYLFDSKLDDRFIARPDNVRLYNDQYYLRANDFEQVDAYSSKGGNDRAYFYDSAGDDTLIALENEARMYGDGFNNVSHGFARAYVHASAGGHDVAHMLDTDGADTVKVSSQSIRMYGPGYYTRVSSSFEQIDVAFSDTSARDRALVFGLVDQSTLNAAGGLASVMNEFGAAYIHAADGFFALQHSDSSDDDDGSTFAALLPETDLFELPTN